MVERVSDGASGATCGETGLNILCGKSLGILWGAMLILCDYQKKTNKSLTTLLETHETHDPA